MAIANGQSAPFAGLHGEMPREACSLSHLWLRELA